MRPGTVIANRYHIDERVGAGGMGAVFRARDIRCDDRLVAVKIALYADNENHRNRFSREARALSECLARLEHPGLVRYIDHGLTAEQRPFLVMEWLEGCELAELIRDRPLSEKNAIELGLQVADALGAAHQSGVIHRDIKPSNIFLLDRDLARAKLLDFGLALLDATMTMATRTGTAMGTPSYMAPEQANTEDAIDHRADLYSLGAVLFTCLTGRAPFIGNHVMAILAKLHLEEPPRVRALNPVVTPAMDSLIACLLRKKPGDRLDSASALISILRAIRAGQSVDLDNISAERIPTDVAFTSENRFTTVALVSQAPHHSANGSSDEIRDDELAKLGQAHDGELVPLAPFVAMLSFSAERDPTIAASQAARFALAVRARAPTTPIVLATGQRVTSRYSSIGDVLERAMSLLDSADMLHPGQSGVMAGTMALAPATTRSRGVALDEVTASLLEGRFAIHKVAAPDRKPGFFLDRAGHPDDSLRSLAGKGTSCVGRRRELMLLRASLDECIDDRVAQRILITGLPGAGKSRLAYELLRHAAECDPPVRVWLARADALRAGSPFGLLSELLMQVMAVTPTASPALRQRQLRHYLRNRAAGADVDERIPTFLGELIGAPLSDDERPYLAEARADHQLMNDRLRETWESWLDGELQRGPLLCILDDIQWSDQATLRFLSLAMRRAEDYPFLLVTLGRPEVRELLSLSGQNDDMIHVALRPLTPRACKKLAQELAGRALGEDTLGRLIERCGGNPFYLEELVRHALVAGSLELPGSVLAMVSARLGGLPPMERRILRAGSVFGAAFSMAALTALLREGDSTLRAPLARLVERRMLDRLDRRDDDSDGAYAFRHEYIREAAYGLLTDDDQRTAHELAARWLERVGERDPVRMAEHYRRADLMAEAIPWFHRAARQALAADDLTGVVTWSDHAIECGATGEIRGSLRLLQAEASNWSAAQKRGYEYAREASRLLPIGSGKWGHALHLQAWSAAYINRETDITDIATQLVAHAPVNSEPLYDIALAHCATLASSFHLQDSLQALLDLLHQRELRGISSRRVRATLAHMRGFLADTENDHGTAIQWLAVAVDEWDALENQRMRLFEESNLATSLCHIGQFRECLDLLHDELADANSLTPDYVKLERKRSRILALVRLGEFAEARRLLSEVIESDTLDDPEQGWLRTTWHVAAALLELSAEQYDDAQNWLESAPTDTSNLPNDTRCTALAVQAQILAYKGQLTDAMAVLDKGLDFHDVNRLQNTSTLLQLVLVETLHACEQTDRARELLRLFCTRLSTLADRIDNPDWRFGFLNRIDEHRRMLALARDWGLDVPALRDLHG